MLLERWRGGDCAAVGREDRCGAQSPWPCRCLSDSDILRFRKEVSRVLCVCRSVPKDVDRAHGHDPGHGSQVRRRNAVHDLFNLHAEGFFAELGFFLLSQW